MSQQKRKITGKTSAEVFGAGNTNTMADDEEFTMETRDASPAHLLIKIQSFSFLSEHEIEKYESREFEAGGYKWRLVIHPNGLIESENKENHISVYLTIVKTDTLPMDWEVNAIFSIFLYNQISDKYLCFQGKMRRFHAMKPQWGFSKLISEESLRDPSNGFLVDDNCVFGAEVAVIKKSQRLIERVLLKTPNSYKREWKISNFSKLEEVWYSEEFTAGDHKWKLILYPNGNAREVGQSVSMFLESVSSKWFAPHEKVNPDFCMCIKNQLNDDHQSLNASPWFTYSSRSWGSYAFMPIADMNDPKNGFIVNDCCIVQVKVSVRAVVR